MRTVAFSGIDVKDVDVQVQMELATIASRMAAQFPQTHEHLAILRLLGVEQGVVAVTKADAVDPELVELVVEDEVVGDGAVVKVVLDGDLFVGPASVGALYLHD